MQRIFRGHDTAISFQRFPGTGFSVRPLSDVAVLHSNPPRKQTKRRLQPSSQQRALLVRVASASTSRCSNRMSGGHGCLTALKPPVGPAAEAPPPGGAVKSHPDPVAPVGCCCSPGQLSRLLGNARVKRRRVGPHVVFFLDRPDAVHARTRIR